LIDAQAQATNQKKNIMWKQIQSREHIQLTAQQVKFMLGKVTAHQPLAIMSKPTERDHRRECMTKQALECTCLTEAGQQFTQANQTPCFITPLWEIFGELGIHRRAFDEVLEGKFIPHEDCDPYAKKVLYQLQKPPAVSDVGLPTIMEYITSWCHVREETSSSYSTVHFGYYMARTQDECIAQFNAQMALIPATTGYSPQTWSECDVGENPW